MAIGLARLWNLKFPNNFNSPYKATSIIDFWRRWHLTLSRFLREYLYIPLGGNRLGPVRRQVNLFITMFLGGLWHGAGWGFALWGSLNGVYLIINHAYRQWRNVDDAPPAPEPWYQREAWGLFTIVFVMLSRVFFRSPTFSDA
jgi:alginate O-acetyltransferase complex protein AlgI